MLIMQHSPCSSSSSSVSSSLSSSSPSPSQSSSSSSSWWKGLCRYLVVEATPMEEFTQWGEWLGDDEEDDDLDGDDGVDDDADDDYDYDADDDHDHDFGVDARNVSEIHGMEIITESEMKGIMKFEFGEKPGWQRPCSPSVDWILWMLFQEKEIMLGSIYLNLMIWKCCLRTRKSSVQCLNPIDRNTFTSNWLNFMIGKWLKWKWPK